MASLTIGANVVRVSIGILDASWILLTFLASLGLLNRLHVETQSM